MDFMRFVGFFWDFLGTLPQELEVGPCSGPYLLVWSNGVISFCQVAPADEGVCMLGEVGGELLVSLHSSLYSVGVGSDNISKVNS